TSTLDTAYKPALAFGAPDPSVPGNLDDFIYAGSTAGHVYVTFSGGSTWTDISKGISGSVQQIVADPKRGSRDPHAVTDTGVYYMADSKAAGASWVKLNDTLSTGVNYTVDTSPKAIAVGNFFTGGFGDDIVTMNTVNRTLSVLKSKGDGTYAAAVNTASIVPVGNTPTAIAAADFNSDGITDVALVSTGAAGNKVQILIGKGNGTFIVPTTTYAVGNGPTSIVAADLNNDGIKDLI